jgi:ribonuclease J
MPDGLRRVPPPIVVRVEKGCCTPETSEPAESYLGHEEFTKLNGGQDLLSFLRENRDLKVDRLIMEGTNVGSSRLPISPSEAIDIIRRLASSSRLLIATLHGLDLEYAYALTKLASELNLECYIASTQTTKLLERIELPLKPKAILEYVDHLTPMDKASLEEMEGKALVLTSYREVIDLLRDMNTACGEALRSSIAVISEPEPQAEEASEYEVIANWMSRMGIQLYRVRASGHYYPYQLEKIIQAVKPREVIPIHTLYPEFLKTYSSRQPAEEKTFQL